MRESIGVMVSNFSGDHFNYPVGYWLFYPFATFSFLTYDEVGEILASSLFPSLDIGEHIQRLLQHLALNP